MIVAVVVAVVIAAVLWHRRRPTTQIVHTVMTTPAARLRLRSAMKGERL